jgi:flagellin FlaB
MWNRLSKDEKGFTGLEAAIVLIAFVVVAAVFSYVMLGAGFYTTQKSQEVVHTGVAQASSSIAPSGDVIVRGDTVDGGEADQITFYITNTAGGTDVDLDKTILSYTDADDFVTKEYVRDSAAVAPASTKGPAASPLVFTNSNGWLYQAVISTTTPDDNLLTKGEKYKVVVDLNTLLDISGGDTLPVVNEVFKLEVKPPEGAVLTISRTLPAALTKGEYYAVY